MNPHDLLVGEDPPRCVCGRTWPGLSLEKAREAHAAHYQVERARAALRGDKEDAGGLDQG